MISKQEVETRLLDLRLGDAVWRSGPNSWHVIYYPTVDEKYRYMEVGRCWYCAGTGCDGCGSVGLAAVGELQEGRPPRGSLY